MRLRNNRDIAKIIKFWWKYIKNKCHVVVVTFLDFADANSYLTFKPLHEKRYLLNYKSHWLQWRKLLQGSTKKNGTPSAARTIFTIFVLNIWLSLLLKYYNFSMTVLVYKCMVQGSRHLSRNMFTYIYACARIFIWREHVFVKLTFFILKFIQIKTIYFLKTLSKQR